MWLSRPSASKSACWSASWGCSSLTGWGGKVTLTQAGAALLPHALGILAAVEAARHEVTELGQLTSGSSLIAFVQKVDG